MYIAGLGFVIVVFAVLLMLGVLPFTAITVGALIFVLGLCVAGPFVIKTA